MGSLAFNKIRLVGFKSFVDPTDFIIEPGLTGIVGPNGCGKSNLLEAIRWVMGANSAKAMRGAAMDDVIFNGTKHRPGRNQAHVTLTIDNSARIAPAQFNEDDTLEITRVITKGSGSKYQINGRTVRAKDIQLLFADASTGANSPALVRQGQISELIAAKPANRRRILEEAAGISGLHSRRHEAELRLRAAETNLSRLEDVVAQIESQLLSLRRQSRQATRYKRLAGEIREYKALLWLKRWEHALATLSASQERLQECETAVQDKAKDAAMLTRVASELFEALKPKREEELIAAAVLARLNEAKQQLARDEASAQSEIEDLQARLEQIEADIARESAILEDADAAVNRLTIEKDTLTGLGDMTAAVDAAEDEATRITAQRDTLEQESDALTRQVASHQARREAAERDKTRAERQLLNAQGELENIKSRLAGLENKSGGDASGNLFATAAGEALAELEVARDEIASLETKARNAEQTDQAARDHLADCKRAMSELRAEHNALEKILSRGENADWTPVIENMDVESGYEIALAVAMGEDLEAGLESSAHVYWAGADNPRQSLPAGALPLADIVKAPPALTACLSQIGVVEDADLASLSKALLPGQRLVTKTGRLMRWDGFVQTAETETSAALRFAQQNRVAELSELIVSTEKSVGAAEEAFQERRNQRQAAQQAVQSARKAVPDIERKERAARAALMQYETDVAREQAESRALTERQDRVSREIAELKQAVGEAHELLDGMEDVSAITEQLTDLQARLSEVRASADEANATYRSLRNEAEARAKRIAAITQELSDWATRTGTARSRLEELNSRRERTAGSLLASTEGPDQFAARRDKLFAELEEAEGRRKAASDALAAAETELRDAETKARAAEAAHSSAREARAAAEAHLEASKERVSETELRIGENLSCEPQDLPKYLGELSPESNLAEADIEKKLERLQSERERMGGVNLRADVEVAEQEERLTAMNEEKQDLIAAIARLREGIDELNSEGRKRLLAAFDTVNGHFGRLFTSLFGGGEAALTLTESDDPLEAGLEIMVSPPGKKLGSMSLMSGGEQALTATALIFAVFLSNPAPICVLDEVDAPLDDANVARYCNLLDEMTRQTNTKFIAITHNAVTMSRMDRLFGVTMAEQGVSQLVSMELANAARLVAAE